MDELTPVVEEDGSVCHVHSVGKSVRYPATHASSQAAVRHRLNTYTDWNSSISPLQLATAGFVHTGIADKVECQSCGIRIYNLQEDEDVFQAHKKYAPDCQFMLENFPQIKVTAESKKIITVKYPYYSDYQKRLRSFDSWPLECVAQKPEMMAKSGFFYIGSADRARCFYCGVTLRDWDSDDFPPCVHKQWSENCPFVQQLDVEEMKEEIIEWERLRDSDDLVSDGNTQVYSPITQENVHGDVSSDETIRLNPAVQAVVEMGYTVDVIEKAADIRRNEGITFPNAVSLLEAILDFGG